MKKHRTFAHEVEGNQNKTDDWLTPPELIDAAGPFDLDPCACPGQPWGTAVHHYFLPEQNGLLLPWKGCVWCNPPYGPHIEDWARRLSLHDDGLLLVFARTETLGFRPVWKYATAILFFYSRVRFHTPDGKPAEKGGGGAPSVLAAFGRQNIERLDRARRWKDGAIVLDWKR